MNQPDNVKIIAAIAVSAVATFALRALPFVLLKYAKCYQKLFAFLGNVMPPGMMMILSLYCLAGLYWNSWTQAGVSFFGLRDGGALAACSPSSGFEHLLRVGGVCDRAKSAEGLCFIVS